MSRVDQILAHVNRSADLEIIRFAARARFHMIANDDELQVTLECIARFQGQVAHLRRLEADPAHYRAAASGFLAEIDRMQLDVREYLTSHPSDPTLAPASGHRA